MADFHDSLAALIRDRKRTGRALIVGVTGVDGSGKTVLCDRLSARLRAIGHGVCRLSIDDFQHPRERRYRRGEHSPLAYYHDSFDFAAFAAKALRPVFDARRYPVGVRTKLFDLALNRQDDRAQPVDGNTIVLAEGVFLFRPEISPFLHLKIFVDAAFETILDRVKVRDLGIFETDKTLLDRYERKYIPGQKLYFEDVRPKQQADIVIDNNDFENPRIVAGD